MAFEKDFDKLVKIKIASVILFIVTLLAAIGSAISGIIMSHKISEDVYITSNFTIKTLSSEIDGSTGKRFYTINVKGSFVVEHEDINIGNYLYIYPSIGNSVYSVDYQFTEKTEAGDTCFVDYTFESLYNYEDIYKVEIESDSTLYTLVDQSYYDMLYTLFIPVTSIAAISFIAAIVLSIIYSKKKKKKITSVEQTITKSNEIIEKQETQPEKLKCPYCGSKVTEEEKTCTRCGGLL